jgi:hypothetical protein
MVVLLVYVDDVLLMGNTENVLAAKAQMMGAFCSHDMGEVSYFRWCFDIWNQSTPAISRRNPDSDFWI